MINLNKRIEVTSSAYIPQVKCKGSKHYNTKFFITTVSLTQMYTNKYYRTNFRSHIHQFKAEVI